LLESLAQSAGPHPDPSPLPLTAFLTGISDDGASVVVLSVRLD
jgi:hypothetical protein